MSEDKTPITAKQLQELEQTVKRVLNPDNSSPQVDRTVSSMFSYVQDMTRKMESADDKEKVANEISEDAVARFVVWAQPYVDQWKAQKELAQNEM